MKKTLLLLLILITSISTFAAKQDTALVIIDMQPYFVERGQKHLIPKNQLKLEALIYRQLQVIEIAKRYDVPILFLEYYMPEVTDGKDTEFRLKRAAKNYSLVNYFMKDTDGMFSSNNKWKKNLVLFLQKNKIKNLIVLGANGGACVRSSIWGALSSEGYNTYSYTEGIADFNYSNFLYPYKGYYNSFNRKYNRDNIFLELDHLVDVEYIMNNEK